MSHLHITFDDQTARNIAKLARRRLIPPAETMALRDYLFLGPMDRLPSAGERSDWLQAFDPNRFDPWYAEPGERDVLEKNIDGFWKKVRAWKGEATVWYSSASAQEASGLIGLMHFAPNAHAFDIINVHILPGKAQHRASASLSLKELTHALAYASRFSTHEIAALEADYQRLAQSPLPLRFVRGGKLLSGAADVHDADLENEVESEFETGEAVLARVFSAQAREAVQADRIFYASRLKKMAEAGLIEAEGDAYELDTGRVRDTTPAPDMLDENRLHIIGSFAAIGLVKNYSMEAGKPIRHIIETRTLFPALGPIDTLHQPETRLEWFARNSVAVHHLMAIDSEEDRAAMLREWHDLWNRLDRWSGPLTVWISSQSAAGRSLAIAIAQHCRRAVAIDFVDVADPEVSNPPLPNVERASPDQIAAAARRARRLSDAEISAMKKDYARLAAANKGLRFIKKGQLVEAPLDHFDKHILKAVTARWRLMARVLEHVSDEAPDEGSDQADHFFWLWRFDELVKSGAIEVDRQAPPDFRVRRAPPQPAG